MSNDIEKLEVSGNLEIWKIFPSGDEEKVFDDHNVITSGMGVGLALLFAGSGADSITDYQVRWAQVGVSGNTAIANSYDSSQYSLVSALGHAGGEGEYGASIDIIVNNHDLMAPDGGIQTPGAGGQWFLYIPQNSIRKSSPTSVTYSIFIPNGACNGHVVNEIGLFMHNPLAGVSDEYTLTGELVRSPLVAYRPFVDIAKTSEFALVFRWTISF